jgi:hypothetical protein
MCVHARRWPAPRPGHDLGPRGGAGPDPPGPGEPRQAGYLTGTEERLTVTPLGQAELEKLVAAVRAWLATEPADWGAADDTKLRTAPTALARHLVDDDPQPLPLPPPPDSPRKTPAGTH